MHFLSRIRLYETNRTLTFSGYAALTLSRGTAGGVMEVLQGGRFGHGFLSAGVSAALSPALDGADNPLAGTIVSAVVGGTASRLGGGKFGNGAVTGAFQFMFSAINNKAATDGSDGTSDKVVQNKRLASRVNVKAGDNSKELNFGTSSFGWDPSVPREIAKEYIDTAIGGGAGIHPFLMGILHTA